MIDTREGDEFVCTLGEEYEDELWVDFDMNAPEDTGRTHWNITFEQEEENNRRVAAEGEHCRRKIARFQPFVEEMSLWTYSGRGRAYDGCPF
mgnify:CR=1 FL=1